MPINEAELDNIRQGKLHNINFTGPNVKLTDADAFALADAMRGRDNIHAVNLSYNDITDAGAIAIIDALEGNPNLISFMVHENRVSDKTAKALERAFCSFRHKNLAAAYPSTPTLKAFTGENGNMAHYCLNMLKEDEALSTADMLEINARRNAIVEVKRNRTAIRQFDAMLDALPSVPEDGELTPDSLLRPDLATGYCPLDNPRIWPDFAGLCGRLSAQGTPLTLAHLAQDAGEGVSYFDVFLAHAPLDAFIAGLNASGIVLRADVLLDKDGKASATFQTIKAGGQPAVNALFSGDNWQGGSWREYQALNQHLPAAMSEAVPNRHQLAASLRSLQTAQISR